MSRPRKELKRNWCIRGCDRQTFRDDGVCCYCAEGRPVPQPAVELLPDEYLARCVEEAIARDEHRQKQNQDGRLKLAGAVARLRIVQGG